MEMLPVMLLLLIFVMGLLVAAYLLFARAWIQYQTEQALYCLAEQRTPLNCKAQLQARLERFLPWGETWSQLQNSNDEWSATVHWNYQNYSFHVAKKLNSRLILNPKVLRW